MNDLNKIKQILEKIINESSRKSRNKHPLYKENIDEIIILHDRVFTQFSNKSINQKISRIYNELSREYDSEEVTCKCCEVYRRKDIRQHIRREHNITIEQYKEEYDSEVICDSTKSVYSKKLSGENNPWYNHSGKFSSLSEKFKKYDTLNTEDVKDKIKEVSNKISKSLKETDKLNTRKEYWINKGYSEEEAKEKIKERQTTFSKEICIKKYGKKDGLERWKTRQEKWQNNYRKSNYSKISQELFWALMSTNVVSKKDVRFASLNNKTYLQDYSRNFELTLRLNNSTIKPDFIYKNKIIEFDGDYWHGKAGNVLRELKRDNEIISSGYEILHIKEKDFNINKDKEIEKCINFLTK